MRRIVLLGLLVVGCSSTPEAPAPEPGEAATGAAPADAPAAATAPAAAPASASASATPPAPPPPPRPDDGIRNADETDVDCGGAVAPKCDVGKACLAHADCASDGCDDSGHCAVARSCTAYDGGRTCGAGEVGDPAAAHGSCCAALPIPGRATKLDVYKITAGRMRAFLDRTAGDVRGWFDANVASLTDAQRAQIEPYKDLLPQDMTSYPYGAGYQLGGTAYLPALPSADQGCFVGTAKNPANGSHTFDNAGLEQEDRGFDRQALDRLPLNCVPYPMLAAFCAWDGGRLETYDEFLAAFGPSTYPWGDAPAAGGYASIGGVWQLFGPGAALQASQGACPTCMPDRANWRNSYQWPAGGNPNKPWDYAYWMSAPGRFPLGAGPGGHQDLAGLLLEITATPMGTQTVTDFTGKTSTQTAFRWSKSGSWEGHRIGNETFVFAAMTKYGKTGGRCARD